MSTDVRGVAWMVWGVDHWTGLTKSSPMSTDVRGVALDEGCGILLDSYSFIVLCICFFCLMRSISALFKSLSSCLCCHM